MKKRSLFSVAFAFSALSLSAFAGGVPSGDSHQQSDYHHTMADQSYTVCHRKPHFGVFSALDSSRNVSTGMVAGVGYYAKYFSSDLGAGFSIQDQDTGSNGTAPIDQTAFNIVGHIGGRMPVASKTMLTGGLKGKYASLRDVDDQTFPVQQNDGWGLGVYVGVDYYLTQHLLFGFKINPYWHRRLATAFQNAGTDSHATKDGFFDTGSISLSYLF